MRSIYFSTCVGLIISLSGYYLAQIEIINYGLMLSGLIVLAFSCYTVTSYIAATKKAVAIPVSNHILPSKEGI